MELDEVDRLSNRNLKKRKSSLAMQPEESALSSKVARTTASGSASSSSLPSSSSSLPSKPARAHSDISNNLTSPSDKPNAALASTTLPYQPTKRVSQPNSIRRPLSRDELISVHQHIEARGANSLRLRWRDAERQQGRDGRDGFMDKVIADWGRVTRTAAGNEPVVTSNGGAQDWKVSSDEVARHYNNRQETGLQARNLSPIFGLKTFNNWAKSVLMGSFGVRGGRAMDMGGGKGGDLQKWDKVGIRELVLADIAATSVEQAEARYKERRFRFRASFYALDCFGESLADRLPREALDTPFDMVSLQFCMHYGWSSLQRARLVIENVSRYLAEGGVFLGTIPNQEELYKRRDAMPPGELVFGNSKYHVEFEQREKRKAFGDKYTFFLADAVDEVPEYVVDWDQFQR